MQQTNQNNAPDAQTVLESIEDRLSRRDYEQAVKLGEQYLETLSDNTPLTAYNRFRCLLKSATPFTDLRISNRRWKDSNSAARWPSSM